MFYPEKVWKLFIWLVPLFLFSAAVVALLNIPIGHGHKKRVPVSTAVSYAVLGLAVAFFPWMITRWLAVCLGIWAVLNAAIRFINGITLLKDHVPGYRRSFFDTVLSLVFGLLFFSNPLGNGYLALLWFGVYLIFYGCTIVGDAMGVLLRTEYGKTKIRRKMRLALPVLVAAFLPRKLLASVSESLREDPPDRLELSPEDNEKPHYLEIFIHLKEGFLEGFGHVDLCLDGTVYSYGCYDTASHRLGGILSDGTMAIAPRVPYIRHCLEFENKKLVGFVVPLTETEFRDVKGALDEILQQSYPWACALEQRRKDRKKTQHKRKKEKIKMDAASILYRSTGAKFVKFKKGKFKTYYVCGTNCVLLADAVIGHSGVDWLRTNGVITPGTYYSHLDSLWKLQTGSVTEKRIYGRKEQTKSDFMKPIEDQK